MKRIYLLFIAINLFSVSIIAQPTTWNSRGIGGGGALFSPSINQGNNCAREASVQVQSSHQFAAGGVNRLWRCLHAMT